MFDFMNNTASSANIPAILIANGVGICLMSSVLFNLQRRMRIKFLDGKLFCWMCRLCLFQCVLETAGFLIDGKVFWGARNLALACNALCFTIGGVLSSLWICYVNAKLFQDIKRLRKVMRLLAGPVALIAALSLRNLFTATYFAISVENVYYRSELFWFPYVITFVLLTAGVIQIYRYRNQVNQYLHLPALSFVIPVYLGGLIQLFCYGIAVIWLSVTIGLTFLYINLQNEKAFLDPLTGLYNRNFLMHYIDELKKNSRGTGIFLDINDFKSINDVCGHMEGDRVLKAVGKILLRSVGANAVAVRYGGDEFVILVKNGDSGEIRRIRETLEKRLREFNRSGKMPVSVSISIGEAEFDTQNINDFFQEMDQNMYKRKKLFYDQQKIIGQCGENEQQ